MELAESVVVSRYKDKISDLLGEGDESKTIFGLERELYEKGIIKNYPILKEALRSLHSEYLCPDEKEEMLKRLENVAFKISKEGQA